MEKVFVCNSALETVELGQKLGELLQVGDCVLLIGDLSAGKTTFTKGVGKGLGVKKIINSPTFTIVKEYIGRLKLYHLDLYRLNGLNNDFDLEEYIDGDGVCIIEWPYQIEELIPECYLKINFEKSDGDGRCLTFTSFGSHYDLLLEALK